jgi:hypothetical protein
MNFAFYTRSRLRRYLTPLLVVAVLLASIAEASHYHGDEFTSRGDAHLQCLLCMHSAGSAGAPHVPELARAAATVRVSPIPQFLVPASGNYTASYDARGPPNA